MVCHLVNCIESHEVGVSWQSGLDVKGAIFGQLVNQIADLVVLQEEASFGFVVEGQEVAGVA